MLTWIRVIRQLLLVGGAVDVVVSGQVLGCQIPSLSRGSFAGRAQQLGLGSLLNTGCSLESAGGHTPAISANGSGAKHQLAGSPTGWLGVVARRTAAA